jgi:hypothetical protein
VEPVRRAVSGVISFPICHMLTRHGRHLGGAHQDNRTVPYEGLPISAMTPAQREEIWQLVKTFNVYLPDGPLEAHMRRVREHEDRTWFAWIGGFGLGDPYYFRIHSPVVFCEVGPVDSQLTVADVVLCLISLTFTVAVSLFVAPRTSS